MTSTVYEGATAIVTLSELPGYRFIVEPDGDANDPIEDSGAPVELFAYRGGYDSTANNNDGYWIVIFKRFYEVHDDIPSLEYVRRFARIFHGWTVEEAESRLILHSVQGYSQSDWLHLFVASPDEGYGNALGGAEVWSQWANGDVYGVEVQRFTECATPDDCHGDEDSHWSTSGAYEYDTLWGIFADDAEEAVAHFAKDYLNK